MEIDEMVVQEKPKRVRRKFDHPLTEEEKKENQKLYWRRWYDSKARHDEKFMEKHREKGKINAAKLRQYKKSYMEEHKDERPK
jgi:hypothetical protein